MGRPNWPIFNCSIITCMRYQLTNDLALWVFPQILNPLSVFLHCELHNSAVVHFIIFFVSNKQNFLEIRILKTASINTGSSITLVPDLIIFFFSPYSVARAFAKVEILKNIWESMEKNLHILCIKITKANQLQIKLE